MSEATETNINPSQQQDRKLKRYTNKIKELTKQLKNKNDKNRIYKNRIDELEAQNNKLSDEVHTLTNRYKKELLNENGEHMENEGTNKIIIKILQKTEAQNEYLRDEIVKLIGNDEHDLNSTIQKCLDLEIIVDHLQMENESFKERNEYLETFLDNVKGYLYSQKYKKRKTIELSTDFCDENGFEYVNAIQALSIIKENEMLRNRNKDVEGYKKMLCEKILNHLMNLDKPLNDIVMNVKLLENKIKDKLQNKAGNTKLAKKIAEYENKIKEINTQFSSIGKLNDDIRNICMQSQLVHKEKAERFTDSLNQLLQRLLKFIIASLNKMNALEDELKDFRTNGEMYNEIIESLKVDFAELEEENENLKMKLEANQEIKQ